MLGRIFCQADQTASVAMAAPRNDLEAFLQGPLLNPPYIWDRYLQALTKAFLNTHGGTIAESNELRERARSLEGKLSTSWGRLDKKLQHVRCLVNFLGNLP